MIENVMHGHALSQFRYRLYMYMHDDCMVHVHSHIENVQALGVFSGMAHELQSGGGCSRDQRGQMVTTVEKPSGGVALEGKKLAKL